MFEVAYFHKVIQIPKGSEGEEDRNSHCRQWDITAQVLQPAVPEKVAL